MRQKLYAKSANKKGKRTNINQNKKEKRTDMNWPKNKRCWELSKQQNRRNTKETVLKPDLECFYWLGYFLSFDHVPWCAACGRLFSYKVWKRTSARRIKWSRWQINSLHSLHKNTFKNILGSNAKKLKTKLTKRTNKNSVSTKTKMLYHWCVLLMLLDPMTESPET